MIAPTPGSNPITQQFHLTPQQAAFLADPALQKLLDGLGRDGEDIRIVGGAIRNALLGMPISDIDLATTATPDIVMRSSTAAGFKPVPTGIDHGTITVVVDGQPFEVTTLRQDVETDGRHARVTFSRDWKADAQRRDFTINGLFLTRDGVVHDFVGGRADIATRTVRFIGDPDRRIREDYLRILRLFRFHATYGVGPLDRAGLDAAIRGGRGLRRLSGERVQAELFKLLGAAGAVAMSRALADAGLFGILLGGVPRLVRLTRLADLEAALDLPPDPVRRLGALGLFKAEDAERIRARLRLSNETASRLAAMAVSPTGLHASPATDAEARPLLYRLGAGTFLDRVLIHAAGQGGDPHAWLALAELPRRWPMPTFPITGHDLAARGIKPGPTLGAALRRLEQAWIDAGFPSDPAWKADALRDT